MTNRNILISHIIIDALIADQMDELFAYRTMDAVLKAMEKAGINFTYSNLESKCIYCQKTSKESGKALFMIKASGMYYQCYPELCPENKEKWLPDNTRVKEKLI